MNGTMSGTDLVAAARRADLVVHLARFAGALRDRNVRPTAFWFGQNLRAIVSLTTATRGVSVLSSSVNVRPDTTGTSIALK